MKVIPGQLVAVSANPDTVLFQVVAVLGYAVSVRQADTKIDYVAQHIDLSMIRKPSAAQLYAYAQQCTLPLETK